MLNSVLSCNAFYYSYTYDLTCTLQHNFQNRYQSQNSSSSSSTSSPALWKTCDPIFCWNYSLSKSLMSNQLDDWIIPVIRGYIHISTNRLHSKKFTFALISRGSTKRAGTRYNMRGVDDEGNVANFCENEQIVSTPLHQYSYLQIRGSIPVYWNQYVNLKYKPKPKIETSSKVYSLFHFCQLSNNTQLINLTTETTWI